MCWLKTVFYTYRYKGEKWIHSSVIGVQWINDGLLDYRLRTTPSKKGKVIHKGSRHHYVSGGEIKNVLDIEANWVKVRLRNGKVGWVERHLVFGNSLTVCLYNIEIQSTVAPKAAVFF